MLPKWHNEITRTQFASVAWQTQPVIRILCYSKRKQAYLFEFAYAEIQNKYFNDRQFYSLSIVWRKKSFFLVAPSSITVFFLHGKCMRLYDIVKSGENMQVYSWKWLLKFRFFEYSSFIFLFWGRICIYCVSPNFRSRNCTAKKETYLPLI